MSELAASFFELYNGFLGCELMDYGAWLLEDLYRYLHFEGILARNASENDWYWGTLGSSGGHYDVDSRSAERIEGWNMLRCL